MSRSALMLVGVHAAGWRHHLMFHNRLWRCSKHSKRTNTCTVNRSRTDKMSTSKKRKVLLATIIACSAAVVEEKKQLEESSTRNRTVWVRNWLAERREKGEYDLLLNQLRLEDVESFRRYLRMNTDTFQELMRLVGPKITKKRTNMREPIPAEAKLAITLRFMATESSPFCYIPGQEHSVDNFLSV